MALIKCPECNKKVSDTRDHCVHCGYKIKGLKKVEENVEESKPKKKSRGTLLIAILITFLLSFFFGYLPEKMNSNDDNDYSVDEKCTNLTSCSDKGYYISNLQSVIYSTGYKNIIIGNCRANKYQVKKSECGYIEVSCDYSYSIGSSRSNSTEKERYSCRY